MPTRSVRCARMHECRDGRTPKSGPGCIYSVFPSRHHPGQNLDDGALRNGAIQLVWSYILDYENGKNPFRERREQISKWKKYAADDVIETETVLRLAEALLDKGIRKIDSLHVACAIQAGADYFLTTDDGILTKTSLVEQIQVSDPIGFIKETET